jgi:pilus assembly protein Flp/PilA
MRGLFGKLIRNDRGATAIEYALIAALIVIALISGVSALGGSTNGIWGNMTNKVVAVEPS